MRAEDVGWAANKIVLGKLGPQCLQAAPQELGIELDSETEVNAAFVRFKDLADRKAEIFDEDIIVLVMDESVTPRSNTTGCCRCRSTARPASGRTPRSASPSAPRSTRAESDGNGPVDASLKGHRVRRAVGAELLLYSVNAITSGQHRVAGRGHRAVCSTPAASSTASAPTRTSSWPRPRPIFRR